MKKKFNRMNHKFTPGEWEADCRYFHCDKWLLISNDKRKIICLVEGQDKATEEDIANANLMAAAPKLLHACETALKDTELLLSGGCDFTSANLEATISVLKKAIKKALYAI